MKQPNLKSRRLILRPFEPEDAVEVQRLAGERVIADTTISVPHPYIDGLAERWIAGQPEAFEQRRMVHFAITLRKNGWLLGAVELRDIDWEHFQAELSFWIGKVYWGRGFASEALPLMMDYGFTRLQLHRIYAHHMVRNPASGHVLEKLGMRREGLMRERVRKWGKFEDVVIQAMLAEEWRNKKKVKGK